MIYIFSFRLIKLWGKVNFEFLSIFIWNNLNKVFVLFFKGKEEIVKENDVEFF